MEKINTPGVWHVYELVLNYTSGTTSMFIDGVQIGDKIVATSDMPMKELKTIELLQLRTETRAKGTVYFDDITITHIPDPEWVTFADISKAKALIGYETKTTFEEGIRKFDKWYKENLELYN